MKCPICRNKVNSINENTYFPFCSSRCKMADLYNWLNEEYVVEEKISTFVDDEREESEEFFKN